MFKSVSDAQGEAVQKKGEKSVQGVVSYFSDPKDPAQQQKREELDQIGNALNEFGVFGKTFKLKKTLEDQRVLHLRMDCEGIAEETIKEFSQKLKGCGLDAHRYHQEINMNMGFIGYNFYTYIAIKGIEKNKAFQISEELRAFAENNNKKPTVGCCTIL